MKSKVLRDDAIREDWSVLDEMRHRMEREIPRLWAQSYLLTESGQPLDFTDRPWLKKIYDDPHPRITVQKAAQVGLTTWAYVRALHRAAVHGDTVIYTLPTDGNAREFVSARINRIIDNSPYLRKLLGRIDARSVSRRRPIDNTQLKLIGPGTIYFKGTRTGHGAISVPANMLVHDEIDYSNPDTLEMYTHRLDAMPAAERQICELSTPTVFDYGINAKYEDSDRREWLVRCESCGWQGPLDYWVHTQGHLTYLRCTNCDGNLDPRCGDWVAAHPGKDVHGYHVSRLMLAVPERSDILMDLHNKRNRVLHSWHFHRMDLGLPSEDGALRITREQLLEACFAESYSMSLAPEPGTHAYYMGVDQGDTLTVVIARADHARDGSRLRIVSLKRLRDTARGSGAWKTVAEDIRKFQIRICVIDGNPNSANVHDLARDFPGRVLACYYKENQRTEVTEGTEVSSWANKGTGWPAQKLDATSHVDITVDRTETLDRTYDGLLSGRYSLPGQPTHPDVDEFIRHCLNNVRRPEERADGTLVNRWVKKGANDYFHALNYLRLAVAEDERRRARAPIQAPPTILGFTPHS
jgi:hypothetical protein